MLLIQQAFFIFAIVIIPQKGFQETALSTSADIAILGGAAGCGKSFTLLMEFTRHTDLQDFGGVIFRRTQPQITSEGGLWDTSMKLYPLISAKPIESRLTWRFRSGCKLKFSHLEYDKNVLDWQGSQIPFIGFDELTHFTKEQFFYMLSRNRSECGIRPYVRATCNPDPDSWVADFISWYIDQETGFPIASRAGVLRYFTLDNGVVVWGNTREEVAELCPHIFKNEAMINRDLKDLIKSFTFIPGSIYENNILLDVDPGYLGNLLSQDADIKSRLLDGNWKIRTDGLGLVDYARLQDIFSNYPEERAIAQRFITCDAARFGRDLCVIFVWKGWEVVYIVVYVKSDVNDIVEQIEKLRRKFNVMKSNVIIDQDGVGGGAVGLGGYVGFKGGNPAVRDPQTQIKENYKNYKTQCYYRVCEDNINKGDIRINLNREMCMIYDNSSTTGYLGTQVKVGGKVWDIRDLIKKQLLAIKRAEIDKEGKKQINEKEEQKNILGGMSPDFADTIMMRKAFDLLGERKGIAMTN